jgi:hypothetical protein
MIDVVTPCLLSSMRRPGGLVAPFFQTLPRQRIHRFNINFLRFPTFFERRAFRKKSPSRSSFFVIFVASCGINLQIITRCQPEHGLTRSHKGHEATAFTCSAELGRSPVFHSVQAVWK